MTSDIATVGDLMRELEGVRKDMRVRAVVQPNYPMLASFEQVQVFTDDDGDQYLGVRISDNEDYGAPRNGDWW